jgi:xanthine/CO dehydrogenase XdhC/CoxF family maturation factor
MTTHRAILEALAASAKREETTVLATVVRVTGSSYGGVGARMLIRVNGSTVGLVSGGCLESDLAEHAQRVHGTGKPEIVRYDTRDDEDAPWGLGLGCNGLIEVLLEPLLPAQAGEVSHILETALSAEEATVIASVISAPEGEGAPKLGAHALISAAGIESIGDWGNGQVLRQIQSSLANALQSGRRGLVENYYGTDVAFEVVTPSVRLVVCGSGPDALPIARLGSQLGWYVTVVDHRPLTKSHVERFGEAKVVECLEPQRLTECVELTPRTAAVVVSHHYERDRSYMEALLASAAGYIGMLGPRARTEKMLADLAAKGNPREEDKRLFAPVGVDIGGDGPDAIALAIIAEVSMVMSGRSAGHLRDRRGPLHAAIQGSAEQARS